MMDVLFRQAARRNNEGVQKLENGDTVGALATLVESLNLMRQVCNGVETSNKQRVEPIVASPIRRSSSALSHLNDEHDDFVYDKAFRLTDNLASIDKNDWQSVVVFAASIILANLAQAHFAHGKRIGHDVSYKSAIKLFETSLEVLSSTSGRDRAVFAVLVFNNLSLIYYDLCKYEESYFCVDNASFLLDRLDGYFLMLSASEVEGLKLNFLTKKKPTGARAA